MEQNQNLTQPAAPATETSKAKTYSGLAIFMSILAILLLATIIGGYFWMQAEIDRKTSEETDQPKTGNYAQYDDEYDAECYGGFCSGLGDFRNNIIISEDDVCGTKYAVNLYKSSYQDYEIASPVFSSTTANYGDECSMNAKITMYRENNTSEWKTAYVFQDFEYCQYFSAKDISENDTTLRGSDPELFRKVFADMICEYNANEDPGGEYQPHTTTIGNYFKRFSGPEWP